MSAGRKPDPLVLPDPSRQAPFPDLDASPTSLPSNDSIGPLLFVFAVIMNAGVDDLCDEHPPLPWMVQRRRRRHTACSRMWASYGTPRVICGLTPDPRPSLETSSSVRPRPVWVQSPTSISSHPPRGQVSPSPSLFHLSFSPISGILFVHIRLLAHAHPLRTPPRPPLGRPTPLRLTSRRPLLV